jgi:hypothetical protein
MLQAVQASLGAGLMAGMSGCSGGGGGSYSDYYNYSAYGAYGNYGDYVEYSAYSNYDNYGDYSNSGVSNLGYADGPNRDMSFDSEEMIDRFCAGDYCNYLNYVDGA